METLRLLAGELAYPPVLFTTAAVLFLAALRSPWPWTRTGGILLAVAAGASTVAVLWSPGPRRLVFAPERLPVAIFLLAGAAGLWAALHQAHGPVPEKEEASSGFTRAELLAGGSAVVLAAVLAVTVGAPLAEMADPGRPPEPFSAPWFLLGFVEAGAYFDPWVAAFLLPTIFLAGLVALPYLDISPDAPRVGFEERREVVLFFLSAVFLLVLFPMASAAFLRDATGEPAAWLTTWRSAELVVPRSLSELLWGLVATHPPQAAWLRELPSAALLALYFVLPLLLFPRWGPTKAVFGRYRQRLGPRRFTAAMVFALALGLLPLKMYLRSILAVGTLLDLPELGFSF